MLPSIDLSLAQYKIYFSFPAFTTRNDIDYIQISIVNQRTNVSALISNYPVGIKVIEKKYIIKEDNTSDFNYYITIPSTDLNNGKGLDSNFYKVQLRFGRLKTSGEGIEQSYTWINSHLDECSEWSKVCLIKGIVKPNLYINEFQAKTDIGSNDITFTDVLNQISGVINFNNEKEYLKSYNVKIIEQDTKQVVFNSGDIYTDSYNSNEFYCEITQTLGDGLNYILLFTYTTSNGYTETVTYTFKMLEIHNQSLPNSEIVITPNNEKGRMQIQINPKPEESNNIIKQFIGNLTIRRTSSKSNFTKWEDVHNHIFKNYAILNYTWYDYTIESGVWYRYCIQPRNSLGSRGTIIASNVAMCVFDDIFLTKKDCQLVIKFNPSLSEFKYNVTESQVVTIGSKYPFIRRNGANYFRSFPIGGLISSLIDMSNWYNPHFGTVIKGTDNSAFYHNENYEDGKFHPERNELKLFTSKQEIYGSSAQLYSNYNKDHNINEYNDYIYEKEFREKIYDFLYQNDVKLFRSTTEGNILIKLMNIDFQPVETLGRMLYSFTATAVEVDEYNITNCEKYNIQTVGTYEKYIESLTHKMGQMTQLFPANKNVLDILTNKYSLIAPDDFITEVLDLTYLKLEIDSDPYVIITDNTGKLVKADLNATEDQLSNSFLGYLVSINGNTLIIPPQMERKDLDPDGKDPDENQYDPQIIHLGYFELKGQTVSINSIQFLYPTTATIIYEANVTDVEDTSKLASKYYHYKNIGQLYRTFPAFDGKTTLLRDIYYKYYFNYPGDYYEKLTWINDLEIEGPTNTVIYIKGPDNTDFSRIILANGFYQLKDVEIMDNSESTNFVDLYFKGRHFTKRTSFTTKVFSVNNKYLDSLPSDNLQEDTIYYIKKDTPVFEKQNFAGSILIVSNDDTYTVNPNHSGIIIDLQKLYDKYVPTARKIGIVISMATGEPKSFKELLRLDDAEYIKIEQPMGEQPYTDYHQIEDPILNGLYTIRNNDKQERWLYYLYNWYQMDENNDINCPIEGIVNYTYEVEKGVYNK